MDDATGGAHDKKRAMRISQDMEAIVENCSFCFKETVTTGDLLDETGEHYKGLSWDTEKDEVSAMEKIEKACIQKKCRP